MTDPTRRAPGAQSQLRFEPASGVRVVALDDDSVVFNPFSWETHVLNPAAALVLDLAAAHPCTLEDVREVLAESLDADERPQADEHARRLLGQLVGLRLLVERTAGRDADF